MIKSTNFKKLAIYFLTAIICCFSITGCSSTPKTTETIGEGSEYVVIHSRAREKSGGVFCIDNNGNIVNQISKFDMQDLSFFSFDENNLLICGGRSNNNIRFDLSKNGAYSEINWLNEPNYSGVTGIKLNGNSALVVMNGNYTDETYLNLVVEQDFQGNVIHQNIIEIYCRDIALQSNDALIAGKCLKKNSGERTWEASIIKYDILNQAIKKQDNYGQYNCFWEIELNNGLYYCLAEDKNELKNIVCVIDPETNTVLHEIKLDDQLTGLEIYNDEVFVVGNNGIYKMMPEQRCEKIVDIGCPENAYVNWAYTYDGSYYVFARLQQRESIKGGYHYGDVFKIDLDTLEKKSTPIIQNKDITMDDILIFPAHMFN